MKLQKRALEKRVRVSFKNAKKSEREESLTELKALLNMNKVNDRNGIQTTYRRHTEKKKTVE